MGRTGAQTLAAMARFPLIPAFLCIGMVMHGCELFGLGKDGREDSSLADACGPTDLERPSWVDDPDITGNLWYVTGMKLFPSVRISDVVDSRPVVHDRVWFNVYPLYLRLDTSEVESQLPTLGNADEWRGEFLNPHDQDVSLRFNRSIVYKGNELPANTNIMDFFDPQVNHNVNGIMAAHLDPRYGADTYRLDTTMFKFDTGCYEVYAGYSDDDGDEIWDTTRVFIDLD